MSGGDLDLTGRWTGVYFYPDDGLYNANDNHPPTPFTAELVDDAGVVSGSTLEPDLTGPTPAAEIRASLEGHHAGGELRFVKYPDSPRQDPIHYTGLIAADGNTISGQWVIPGDWSGSFRMQRKPAPVTVGLEARAAAQQ